MDVTCTCGVVFQARSAKARYCSDRCRKRKGKSDALVVTLSSDRRPPDVVLGSVEKATLHELDGAGRAETAIGQSCLALARRLDAPGLDTGSAMSSVAGRLDELMAKALKGTATATSPQQLQDELAERRRKHGA